MQQLQLCLRTCICHADLNGGITQYVSDPASNEPGQQPAGELTVTQSGTLEGINFDDQAQMGALFPDAESAKVTGRT